MDNSKSARQMPDDLKDQQISRALPKDVDWGSTLARRLTFIREWRGMSKPALARESHFKIDRLNEIEAGMETWLSSSDRQLLALALKVDASILQEVESRPRLDPTDNPEIFGAIVEDIKDSILTGVKELECPQCGHTLRCRVQEGLDMEGRPMYRAKAFCTKCPFVI